MIELKQYVVGVIATLDRNVCVLTPENDSAYDYLFPTYALKSTDDALQTLIAGIEHDFSAEIMMDQCTLLEEYTEEDMAAQFSVYMCVVEDASMLKHDRATWIAYDEISNASIAMRGDIHIAPLVEQIYAHIDQQK